ncbi:type II toxin-antitoxin system Phd/YefM family antitoxin [Enteractinococcus helveticum]|uniref:Antitoxin n=1 Tax=Enteractinococcus helveticum TaxID=1837282 RepID=A0A1B7M0M7_9MICC|nr:type II toxin-antitoxin system Phd/YefM family antitoxin [Enteractinococcus helveticum]OAV61808.1 hypothetical protein A6F49_07895 [Enteractinococcus helveticum]
MTMLPPHIWTSADARKELPNVLKRFRKDGINARPMVFGSHRKPEAAVIPYELYERIAMIIEDHEIAELVRKRSDEGPAESMDELFAEYDVELPHQE